MFFHYQNYQKLFSRENHPTYYDNVIVFKLSSEKEKEFTLPIQHIYSEKVDKEDVNRWNKYKK